MWVNLPKVGPAALVVPETQGGGTVLCGAARGEGQAEGWHPFGGDLSDGACLLFSLWAPGFLRTIPSLRS